MPTGTLVTAVVVVPDVVVVVILDDAVMYVAPAEKLLATLKMIDAVPVLSVRAVEAGGVNVTSEVSDAAKVTMEPFTGFPPASVSSAVTVTGFPKVTTDGTLKTREATEVVVVLLPVEDDELLLPPQATRQQSAIKEISSHIDSDNLVWIDFTILLPFLKR
ncbi:MAG: hypothetical protein ABSF20_02485 [Smithella sp.]|jgi:hypothetical protein